ncbi:oligosaccharide flippase family protein [Patescibacteria group bacterium]|nr:oligosaccharide flippase family protein [Patescibacteria group bacterium]MBU1889986.1 oligosaccharide flippase family protein [Patescibacteria group bacterium]
MIKAYNRILIWLSKSTGFDFSYFALNGLWVGLRQLISIITGLVVSITFARLTSQELYGNYQYIISIMSIIAIITLPGLNTSIIQATARGFDGGYKKSVRKSFLWSLVGIPALFIIGAYYYINNNTGLGSGFMVSSIFFPFLYAPKMWDSLFQGKSYFKLSTIYASIQSLVHTLAMITVIYLFSDSLIAIVLVFFFISLLFNAVFYLKSVKYINNQREDSQAISYGYFLTKIRILATIAAEIDKVVIGIFLGPASLAIYAIGVTLAYKFFEFTKNLLVIASPKIARTNTVSNKKYLQLFFFFLFVAMILFFILPTIVTVLYSDKYKESILLSQLVILFLPFYVLNTLYKTHFMLFLRNRKILFLEAIIYPVLKILLTVPLLVFFKIEGLALLYGLQYPLNMLILYVINYSEKRKVKKPPVMEKQ